MPKSIQNHSFGKPSAIDLGALQRTLESARKLHVSDAKALERALEAEGRSRAALERATEALKAASRAVLS